MMPASSRSEGRRSPTCRSPALMRSAICSTASSKVRRDETGSNELSKPIREYLPASSPSAGMTRSEGLARRTCGLDSLEGLPLGHVDRGDAIGVGALEGRVEARHRARDQL